MKSLILLLPVRWMTRNFCAALLLGSCGMLAAQAQIEIMPLGDSITKGGGSGNDGTNANGYYLQSGYRSELYTDLVGDKISFTFVGANTYHATSTLAAAGQAESNGYGSYTLNDIYQNLAGASASNPEGGDNNEGGYWLTGGGGTGRSAVFPNIVLLLGGTNDIDYGYSLATVEANMNENLSWFATYRPQTTVIVGTVIPFVGSASTPQLNTEVTAFNLWLKTTEVPSYSNDRLVDLNTLFTANESTYYSTDGIHPDATGYNAMGDEWASAIQADMVPEPGILFLLLTGMAGGAVVFRRQLVSR